MSTIEPEDDLRNVLKPTPANAPDDIDSAIRKHARHAVNTVAASDVNSGKRPGSWLRRTLPVAAVVTLAIGVIPHLQQEPATEVAAPAAEAQQSPVAVPTLSLAESVRQKQSLSAADSEIMLAAEAGVTAEAKVEAAVGARYRDQARTEAKFDEETNAESNIDVNIDVNTDVNTDRKSGSSLDAIEELSSFGADTEPPVEVMAPQPSPTLLRESTENSQSRDILVLLRSGNERAARIAYKKWRQAWPDADPVPSIKAMSDAEINWFEAAADRFDQSN